MVGAVHGAEQLGGGVELLLEDERDGGDRRWFTSSREIWLEEENQRKGRRGHEDTATCWWCLTAKGAPVVLLLVAARGKHGRRAMGVGVEWIEELLWLGGRANRGGAVESAGW